MAYLREELEQARRALSSTLSKCRKAALKRRPGSPQDTLLGRRIRALEISLELLEREMGEDGKEAG